MNQYNLNDLMGQFPVHGELTWIGLRPARKQKMVSVLEAEVNEQLGLMGDHYAGRSRKRQVTLIQHEHISVMESFTGKALSADVFRRNLVIKGINLLSLKRHFFKIGSAVFKTTGLCHPCSRMEQAIGEGGYNAMRQHGGINCQVIVSGYISVGDALTVLNQDELNLVAEGVDDVL